MFVVAAAIAGCSSGQSTGPVPGPDAAEVALTVVENTVVKNPVGSVQFSAQLRNASDVAYSFNACIGGTLERQQSGAWRAVERTSVVCTAEARLLPARSKQTLVASVAVNAAAGAALPPPYRFAESTAAFIRDTHPGTTRR